MFFFSGRSVGGGGGGGITETYERVRVCNYGCFLPHAPGDEFENKFYFTSFVFWCVYVHTKTVAVVSTVLVHNSCAAKLLRFMTCSTRSGDRARGPRGRGEGALP